MNKEIPVFFAVDNGYIPFLGVALSSLIENTSKENKYAIKVLYTRVTEENKARIKKYEKENFNFVIFYIALFLLCKRQKLFWLSIRNRRNDSVVCRQGCMGKSFKDE